MNTVLFLHDTDLALRRGAELTLNQLLSLGSDRGFRVQCDQVTDLEATRHNIAGADLVVVSSTSRCAFEKELLTLLIQSGTPYVKLEFDHNFCVRRTIYCTVDPRYRNCCDPEKFHLYRELFAQARINFFQSPAHYENHRHFYGEAVSKHQLMPPTVEVGLLHDHSEKQSGTIPFFGDLSLPKGGHALVEYALEHPELEFSVYGKNKLGRDLPPNVMLCASIPNEEVLEILGKSRYLFSRPFWPEPSGRLVAEAWLSGCEVIGNERIGTFSYDFYPNDKPRAIREIQETPHRFWDTLSGILNGPEPATDASLGHVLVKKSYGGLGDIFFVIPALQLLAEMSDSVTFLVEERLVRWLQGHLPNIRIRPKGSVSEETDFDRTIELGNCPAFGRREFPEQLDYVTHKKVRQHAMFHYADAIAKLHPKPPKVRPFPYFQRLPELDRPYYTIHPGAGFLLKTWPVQRYAALMGKLQELFPGLDCEVVIGPGDPDPMEHFTGDIRKVRKVTGGIEAVGQAMEKALFHIGNDAGITHVAGAYNVPTVGIYGPTGPGAWGSLSEQNEIVWGKPGNCELRCNYEVILACQDRVCLSSIDVNMALGAVFRLLQKTYPDWCSREVISPDLKTDFSTDSFVLRHQNQEFQIHFTDVAQQELVKRLLGGDLEVATELVELSGFLREQKMLVRLPDFGH